MSKNRPKLDVEKSLALKGFRCIRQSDHNYFIFHTEDGKKTRAKTKTSFGRKPENIAGDLLHAMARQCGLTNDQFLQLIDCPLSRQSYEKILDDKGFL